MEKIEVVIDRSKWRCGGTGFKNQVGNGDTQLCNSQGFYCCLGFISKKVRGNSKGKIVGLADPAQCKFDIPELIESRYFYDKTRKFNTHLANQAITINDNTNTTYKQKEKLLKALFKDTCYKLKFVGEPVQPNKGKK